MIRHWPVLKAALLQGDYQPQPVLRVQISKSGGGVRQLGISTAVDRLIQQAVHQVLSPLFDPGFSEFSHGFRLAEVKVTLERLDEWRRHNLAASSGDNENVLTRERRT